MLDAGCWWGECVRKINANSQRRKEFIDFMASGTKLHTDQNSK
jgi:hypothetical protein